MEKKKYKLIRGNHIHDGKPCKVGDIIELTDEQAAAFVNKLEPVKESAKEPEAAPKEETKSEYDSWTVKDLREGLEAMDIEIPDGSKKADLVKLLEDADTESK